MTNYDWLLHTQCDVSNDITGHNKDSHKDSNCRTSRAGTGSVHVVMLNDVLRKDNMFFKQNNVFSYTTDKGLKETCVKFEEYPHCEMVNPKKDL